ncbi:MAG: hypothetical protein U5K00_09105 [Melioribacteraceae bacterium]|nr:hypothetical protein [Melioribacteraceae bacterium]
MVKNLEIRRVLSESHLYSSAFVVEMKNVVNEIPQGFVIKGAGWGHGVGLCQIGAAVMGEMGYLFDEILLHYFRGARIEKGVLLIIIFVHLGTSTQFTSVIRII